MRPLISFLLKALFVYLFYLWMGTWGLVIIFACVVDYLTDRAFN